MFDKETLDAVLIVAAIWLVARWLVADRPLKWVPRIIRGGKR